MQETPRIAVAHADPSFYLPCNQTERKELA